MSNRLSLLLGILLLALTAAILFLMGRAPICPCGEVKVWGPGDAVTGGSQHIADWYTFSHIIHGFIFFGVLWLLFRRRPIGERALGAILIEAAWELLENSPFVIDRYRDATVAAQYSGDTIVNSMSDILFMLLGFWFASKVPAWVTIVTAIFFELLALYTIRDNLTLNVIMLLYPLEAIKQWQAG